MKKYPIYIIMYNFKKSLSTRLPIDEQQRLCIFEYILLYNTKNKGKPCFPL